MASRIVKALKSTFEKHRLLSNCVVYGSLYAGAEFGQQTILRKLQTPTQKYDMELVGRYALLGSTVFPTYLYYWYKLLDGKIIGTSTRIVIAKTLLDQCISAPPILFVFFVGNYYYY